MSKLKFDNEFQNRLLGLIVYSPGFLKAARTLVTPDHFKSDEQWIICTLAYRFFDKYGSAPKQNLLNEIVKHAQTSAMSQESRELTETLFNGLYPDFSAEKYCYEEIIQFSKHEDLRSSLERFLPRFKTGDYDLDELARELEEIDQIHRIALDGNSDGYSILSGFSTRTARRARSGEVSRISTLISPLDEKFQGIEPRQLATVMAPSGIGKSFMLIHLAKAAVLQGKNVFFFTLEMNEDDIADRFDQMTVGAKYEDLGKEVYIRKLQIRMRRMINRGGCLIIKFLTPGTTVTSLKKRIEDLMSRHKVVPQLVIVDYGELLSSGQNIRETYVEQKEIWQDLHDICTSMDLAIWTATQSSRGGVGVKHMSELEVGDSYWKYRISDIFVGFNRYLIYDREKKKWEAFDDKADDSKIIRFFVMKHRKNPDKYRVVFVSDLKRGLFYSKKETEIYLEKKAEVANGGVDKFTQEMENF